MASVQICKNGFSGKSGSNIRSVIKYADIKIPAVCKHDNTIPINNTRHEVWLDKINSVALAFMMDDTILFSRENQRSVWSESQSVTFDIVSRSFENKIK